MSENCPYSVKECRENHWYNLPKSLNNHDYLRLEKAVHLCNRRLTSVNDLSERTPIQLDSFLGKIRFNGISGFLNLDRLSFNIRPKFMVKNNWISRFSDILVLGSGSGKVVVLPGTVSSTLLASRFVDSFARLFANSLLKALSSHPLLAYKRIERDISFVRGRVLLAKQLNKPPTRQHRVSCSYSNYSSSNQYIQVIRWAVIECHRLARTRETRLLLKTALDRLPNVETKDSFQYPHLQALPAGMSLYREPYDLALEIVKTRRRSASSTRSSKKICGVIAIMHECYESLVSYLYRRISIRVGVKTKAQNDLAFMSRLGTGLGSGKRSVRPDDTLFCSKSSSPILVSDSKYVGRVATEKQKSKKRLDASNFYQVVCSCISAGTNVGLIVQPFIEDIDETISLFEEWEISTSIHGGTIFIGVLRLDLRSLNPSDGLRLLENQLETGVKRMLALRKGIDDGAIHLQN